MKQIILWDLDGTLTDPKVGIITSIQYALREKGFPVPEMHELLWCIGPALYDSFPKITGIKDKEMVLALVDKYRERFAKVGLFENELIDGIPQTLTALSHKKHFVATAKPHAYAGRIVEHFSLHTHFKKVYGSELDGTRTNKGDLILYLLEQEKLSPADVLIVGDREHDVLGAKKAGIDSVGVLWGYGSREELQKAGADAIVSTPAELLNLLR